MPIDSSELSLNDQDDNALDESQSVAEFIMQSALASAATGSATTTASTTISSSVAASGTSASASTPAWIRSLSTSIIATDMASADVNGTVSAVGLTKLLTDLDSTLSSVSKLSSAAFADLKTIAANLNNGLSTSAYLTYVFNALVNGNAANATWTGGGTSSVTLGNLAVGSSVTQLSELTGKWLLGTDLPSNYVNMTGDTPFTISYSTVSNSLFGSSGPSINDINQGYLGDCFFLAGCAEVASQNASAITSMFTNNGNGTYGVRFYVNGVAEYVTVNLALADGGSEFNSANNIWASLTEKAYTQLQASGIYTGNSENDGNSYSTIGNGGDPAYGLEAITGASIINEYAANRGSWVNYTLNSSLSQTNYSSGMSSASLLQIILADLNAHDDVIISSETDAYSSGKLTLVADHAMSVYGYDLVTGMLEVRNPWGTASGQYWNTTFEVSLATLLADGDWITTDNAGASFSNTSVSTQSIVTIHVNSIALSGDVTGAYNFIDVQNLEASYSDLIKAFGTNEPAMQSWVNAYESTEQRNDTFDGLDYVASYSDLISQFRNAGSEHAVLDAGAAHFIQYGNNEGRTTTFNGLDYIASYGDLIKAVGLNGDAGAYHYIEYGVNEGRTTTFDGLDYIASYNDLATAFGANEQAGAAHFIQYGSKEGRTTTFDGLDYIAGYTDLMKAFGANNDAGAAHYISNGMHEGRSAAAFNVAAYESAHTDLLGKYASNDAFLTAYINTYATTGTLLT